MEKKRSPIIPIILAVAIGLATIVLLNNVIRPTPVVVAKVAVAPGTVLTSDLVEARTLPAQARPRDGFSRVEDVIGKMVVVSRAPGDWITAGILGDAAQAGIPSQLERGHVALAVRVDLASGAAGLLRPGQTVTVIGMLDPQILQQVAYSASTEAQSLSITLPNNPALPTEFAPELSGVDLPTATPTVTPTTAPPNGPLARIAISGLKVLVVPQSFRYEELPTGTSEEQMFANARSASSSQQGSVIVLDVPAQAVEAAPDLLVNPATLLAALDRYGVVYLALESGEGLDMGDEEILTLNMADLYNAINNDRSAITVPTAVPTATVTPTPTETALPPGEAVLTITAMPVAQ